jgi:hypothetical protein
MAMAGCAHCALVMLVLGFPDARIGEVWHACTECGEPMRWVDPVDAARLVSRREESTVPDDPAASVMR